MSKTYCTYALLDPRKPGNYTYGKWNFKYEPFYIGKGRVTRLKDHVREATKTKTRSHKLNKIRAILKSGLRVKGRILQEFRNEQKAFRMEANLIAIIGRRDLGKGPLANRCDGGEGSGGHSWSQASRAKLANTLTSRTEKERAVVRQKISKTWEKKTQEELDARSEKIRKAMQAKSKGELYLIEQQRLASLENRPKAAKRKTREAKQLAWASKTKEELATIRERRLGSISEKQRKEINAKLRAVHQARTEKEKAAIRERRSAAVRASWERRRQQFGPSGRP